MKLFLTTLLLVFSTATSKENNVRGTPSAESRMVEEPADGIFLPVGTNVS